MKLFKKSKKLEVKRLVAVLAAAAMLGGYIPTTLGNSVSAAEVTTSKVADPNTATRPVDLFAGTTLNAGRVMVGKTVDTDRVNYSGEAAGADWLVSSPTNFLVTISQAAQTMGVSSEIPVPVDAVFVLDTSGSMAFDIDSTQENNVAWADQRATHMVAAANEAIESLLAANELNRVAVVAFSDSTTTLSTLHHYTGTAATEHLTWSGNSIRGRDTDGTTGNSRNGKNGGTNIHAGIAAGAQILASAANTTVTIGGKEVTRIPFLIVLSDGAPTYSGSSTDWTKPTGTQGPGSSSYVGNGFLPVLTASYYKNVVSEHYFGDNVSSENRAYMYTIGVGVDGLSATDKALAEITLNPKDNMNENNQFYRNNTNHDFEYYWQKYQADETFEIRVNQNDTYTIGQGTYREYQGGGQGGPGGGQNNWVEVAFDNHQPSVTSLLYNDNYYPANNASGLDDAFRKIVVEIQKRAITYPTLVDEEMTADFSGYVTFRDVIGEYMEIKDMKGIVADGHLFQGAAFAYYMNMTRDEVHADAEATAFMQDLIHSMEVRFGLRTPDETDLTHASMDDFLNDAWNWAHDRDQEGNVYTDGTTNPRTQMYYNSDTDFDNSICWWGHTAADGTVQMLGWAADDSIEYIETAKEMAADGEAYRKAVGTAVAEGADYVARSYFFYGTAGNTVDKEKAYLDFSLTVMRELEAPYTQTVVISAPASLLSMQRVLIYDTDKNGELIAYFDEVVPTRVVYEVGLRDDITAESAESILSEAYKEANKVDGGYVFYTNEWLRNPAEGEAEALTSATFNAESANAYYVFDVDTPIYVKDGDTYVKYTDTAQPSGEGYYYAHEYYTWDEDATVAQGAAGVECSKVQVEYVEMNIPEDSVRVKWDSAQNCWVVMAGTFKAQSLVEHGIEKKQQNPTETGDYIAYPIRTGGETNPHYTVYLGNNGKLTFATADAKSVFNATGDDIDGLTAMVGEELTYQVTVSNTKAVAADATIVDTIPSGTELVEGSVKVYKGKTLQNGGYSFAQSGDVLTWNFTDVPAGSAYTVEFKVKVTEAALDISVVSNQATVTIDGNTYTTNLVSNPIEGKKATGATSAVVPSDGVQVGDQIVYTIQYYNDTTATSDVKIVDKIPAGTAYVAGSATGGGTLGVDKDGNPALLWTIENVAPGTGGTVSFKVEVTAAALTVNPFTNTAAIQIGTNAPIQNTNEVETDVKIGDLELSKVVETADDDGLNPKADQKFVLVLTETSGMLGDTGESFDVYNGTEKVGSITFDTNDQAEVTILDGQTLTVKGLPVGVTIVVTEEAVAGYTPTYAPKNSVTIVKNDTTAPAARVEVTNTYAPESTDDLWKLDYIQFNKHLVSDGAPLSNKTFSFVAHPANADGTLSHERSTVIHGTVTVNSGETVQIEFDELRFTKTGTYYFLIDETVGSDAGITYDIAEFLLKVEVFDDGTGKLKIKEDFITLQTRPDVNGEWSDATAADAVFTNVYTPASATVNLVADKVLNNRNLSAIGFNFTFEVVDAAGNVVVFAQNDENGDITFPEFTIDTIGEYTYTIREVNGGRHGYTYDTDEFTVTVKVTDDGQGQLDAEVVYPTGGVVFENTYTPDTVKVALEAYKVLTGRALVAGEFEFKLVGTDETDLTARNDVAGKITFPEIEYELADAGKTYTYTISEVKGSDSLITYSDETIEVTVAVSYDRATGRLSASVTYPDDTEIKNVFNPPAIEVVPQAVKVTENKTSGDEEFSFVIVAADDSNVTTGTSGLHGTVAFGEALSFGQAGTYYYWIKEVAGTEAGITYDTAVYAMKVVVTADETTGLLSAETEYGVVSKVGDTDYTTAYGEAVFVNNYKVADGKLTIVADKVLHGRDFKTGDVFTFVLKDSDGNVIDSATADIGNAGLITFDPITYNAAGEYTYTVEESSENLPGGVSRDDTVYTITVEVKEVDATYQAELTEVKADGVTVENKAIVFTNTYTPASTTITLGDGTNVDITKVLNGRPMVDGEFSFQLQQVGGTYTDTKTNQSGKVTFDTITYTGAGTYIYTIKEVAGTVPGVTYNTTEYTVTVTVTDNLDGQLVAAVTDVQKDGVDVADNKTVQFVNTYKAEETSIKIEATKLWTILNGDRELSTGDFSFILEDETGHRMVVTNDADGKIVFENHAMLTFAEAGDYTYTVYEVKESLGGVEYDDESKTKYEVVVSVIDNTETGKLEASISSVKKNGVEDADKKIVFNNKYTAAPTSLRLTAVKSLIGRRLVAEEFRFEAQEVLASGGLGEVKALGWNDADGSVIFNAITFDQIGEYTFKVYEATGDLGGVTYDDNYYMVVIEVKDNGNGSLEASVKSVADKEGRDIADKVITFTNSYAPKETTITLGAEGTVDISKVLIGRPLKGGEFTFALTGTGLTEELIATNDADGKIVFPEVTYTAAGRYVYNITEKDEDLGGITYTTKTYKVVVEVTDNQKGQLVAQIPYVAEILNEVETGVDRIMFENTYQTGGAELTLVGDKEVVGHYFHIADGMFNFVVKDLDGNEVTSGFSAMAADGERMAEIIFEPIKYTFEDYVNSADTDHTFTYIISESASGINGMTDDVSEYIVTVQLTDDGEGNLSAEVTYPNSDGKVTFTNTYKPEPTSIVLTANKKLDVQSGDLKLTKDQFSFYVARQLSVENYLVLENKGNDADGKIEFSAIEITEAGKYIFAIGENVGHDGDAGITYDHNVYMIEVTVTDEEGQLEATITAVNLFDGENLGDVSLDEAREFVNLYTAKPADVEILAGKELTGKDLAADEFRFMLEDSEGNQIYATNDANGMVTFTQQFTQVGTYKFTLSEAPESVLDYITYDATKYEVTVVINDDGKGQLYGDVYYGAEDALTEAAPVFKNTYTPDSVTVDLTLEGMIKDLIGRDMVDGEFIFEVKDADGNVVVTGKNDKDGKIVFDKKLTYTEKGEYTYTVYEVAGDDDNVTYDAAVFTMNVAVTDDGEGVLTADVTYGEDGKGSVPVFENTHTPDAVEVVLEALKELVGRELKDGEFTFEVKDAAGDVVATGKNDADGKIVFSEIKLTAGEYTYTVYEVIGEAEDTIYDKAEFKVTVKVSDTDNDGVLEEKITYPEGGVKFINENYTEVDTGDNSQTILWIAVAALCVVAVGVVLVIRKKMK